MVAAQRTKQEWAEVMRRLSDEYYPRADKIVLVMDHLNTHTLAALYEVFPVAEARCLCHRFEVHDTPKHASWLNMAEIELNVLMGQCLNRRIDNMKTMKEEVKAWESHRNNKKACNQLAI